MARVLPILCFWLLAGCTTEREERSGWTLHAVEGTCPTNEAATPDLLETWGKGATRIDGLPCVLEKLVSVAQAESTTVDGCCYAVTCNSDLSPVEELALYEATCFPLRCDAAEWTDFTPDDVRERLAARVPQCTLGATETAPESRDTLQCVYSVRGRYSCSTAPG